MWVLVTHHTFPRSGPHSTRLIWNGQKDTQLRGRMDCRTLCPAPLPHLRLVQKRTPSRKGSCHQPTNTTPVSPGAQKACKRDHKGGISKEYLLKQRIPTTEGAQVNLLLTCPGDTCSGTPSSTEMLPLSMSSTQSTGTLLETMVSPQSS